ncbi:hypothetical protein ACHAXN_008512 [Cyclotella atomus]|jgi:hypothetical protein
MPHVTFSNDVSKVDGHSVTIEERRPDDSHSTASNPFLGRTIAAGCSGDLHNQTSAHDALVIGSHGSFGRESAGGRVVENLVVRMGILKCGHRYRVSVPLPAITANRDEVQIDRKMDQLSLVKDEILTKARIVRVDDDDLRGEIADDGRCLNAILSARQRGPYNGRILIEIRSNENASKSRVSTSSDDNAELQAQAVKCILIQVEASIMGKGMGTPQLRNGVACLGKLVGYDSDEETEWRGFD